MESGFGVLLVYGALAIWLGLLVRAYKRSSYKLFIWFGIGFLIYLNARYLIEGAPAGIAFFIGIYDVVINLGLAQDQAASGMTECVGNACTVWGDEYTRHSTWGVAFYERFANGDNFRSNLLYGHLTCNSIVFILMHIQMMKSGFAENANMHRLLGRISFALLTIGVGCAVWLASEHGAVPSYGGAMAEYGFYSMSAFVYGSAIMGVLAIRSGNHENHRIWMWRFAGSMWGSFWLFRAMLLFLDPLFRNQDTVAILLCIWLSAPLGILIAEMIRRSRDQKATMRAAVSV
ncbi:MAG: DUF2306 domain-containing protein [Rhizobiaceae bacterium]|nr:DUF2306 domain-containing protein [Rhizobiaceae bacterium]